MVRYGGTLYMSVERWAKRASGFLVPTLGLANLTGQMQPCPDGDCCDEFAPVTCLDCYDGTMPNSVWIDFPALGNVVCAVCDSYEDTYVAGNPSPTQQPCIWGFVGTVPGSCFPFREITMQYAIALFGTLCRHFVSFSIRGQFDVEQSISWLLDPPSPVSTIDLTLNFSAETHTVEHCDPVGTTVHIFE